jgi:chaperonin GroES
MKLKPLGERALVKMVEREQTTESGIVLPDTAKEKPQTAEVVAVGEFEEGVKVEVGEVVVLRKFAGTEVDLDGEEHLIVKIEDILGVVGSEGRQAQQQGRDDQQDEEKGLVEKVKDTLTGE